MNSMDLDIHLRHTFLVSGGQMQCPELHEPRHTLEHTFMFSCGQHDVSILMAVRQYHPCLHVLSWTTLNAYRFKNKFEHI